MANGARTTAEPADVIVVGAGLAGLAAARALHRRGVAVRVLEARGRVGGRTWTRRLDDGHVVDLGGQWIGPGQHRIAALLRELGIETFPQPTDGRKMLILRGRTRSYRRLIPPLSPWALLDLHRTVGRLDALSAAVPLERPQDAPQAAAWDAISLADWQRRHMWSDAARDLLTIAVQSIFAAEPAELSFLHFLFYVRSGGGLLQLAAVRDGAQQTRVRGGTQQIAERLAAVLGAAVVLDAAVRGVRQTADGVLIRSDAGVFGARRVVVAVPPPLAAEVEWDPPLPPARAELVRRIPMGAVAKCVATYPAPFWRRNGWLGEVVSDEDPVRLVFDGSPPGSPTGALIAFVLGAAARDWGARPAAERRAAVLAQLAGWFGSDARQPSAFTDCVWAAERWSGGGYAAVPPPGVLTRVAADLRTPVGRVHWAGTETARRWNGYMDGALESGERVAIEVSAALAGD